MEKLYISGATSSVLEGTGLEISNEYRAVLKDLRRMRSLDWLEDYKAALYQARVQDPSDGRGWDRIMAVFTGSDWCQYCKKLREEILQNQIFIDWFKMNALVPLLVDFPKHSIQPPKLKEQNAKLFEQYNIQGFPMVITIRVTGTVCPSDSSCYIASKEISRIIGYVPGTDVNAWIANYCVMANLK